MTVLVGDEHELRRQAAEIDYLEGFLKYLKEGESMECVSTWHLHQQFREKLCDFKFFRQEIDAQLDAKISGKLTVIVDEDKASIISPPSLNSSPQRKIALSQRPVTPVQRDVISPSASPEYYNHAYSPMQYGILEKVLKITILMYLG